MVSNSISSEFNASVILIQVPKTSSLGHSSVDSQPSSVEIRKRIKSYIGELYFALAQYTGHVACVWGHGLCMGTWPGYGDMACVWGHGLCMGTWPGYGAKLHALIHGRGRRKEGREGR